MIDTYRERLQSFCSPHELLVATDLVDLDRLIPHVITQARASHARVTVVHAVQDLHAINTHRARLIQAIHSLTHEGVSWEAIVRLGDPLTIVEDVIAETGAERLVIGANRLAPCGPKLLGAVSNALLLESRIPVFAVGPHVLPYKDTQPKKIVHPVSFRDHNHETTLFSMQLAKAMNAQLILVHVLEDEITASPYANAIFEKARHELKVIAGLAHTSLPVLVAVQTGEVALELLQLCAREKPTCIVIGVERDPPWWSMQNNLACRMIAEATSPVLAVRTRQLSMSGQSTESAAMQSSFFQY
jgi:nucleotide-binding universal stress UspA family protein